LSLIAAVSLIFCCVPRSIAEEAAGGSMVELGLKISPVPINLQGRDRNLVGWGSYLVNAVADCSGCHTYPQFLTGGDPFLGTGIAPITPVRNAHHYLAGGFCFGRVMSSNLTPNLDTGLPSNMTLRQFTTAMRSGRGNSASTLRIMPWPTYHNMAERDINAIYQYLSAIPHAEPCNNSCPPSYPNSRDCPKPAPPR
jgi:cytochrome c553